MLRQRYFELTAYKSSQVCADDPEELDLHNLWQIAEEDLRKLREKELTAKKDSIAAAGWTSDKWRSAPVQEIDAERELPKSTEEQPADLPKIDHARVIKSQRTGVAGSAGYVAWGNTATALSSGAPRCCICCKVC